MQHMCAWSLRMLEEGTGYPGMEFNIHVSHHMGQVLCKINKCLDHRANCTVPSQAFLTCVLLWNVIFCSYPSYVQKTENSHLFHHHPHSSSSIGLWEVISSYQQQDIATGISLVFLIHFLSNMSKALMSSCPLFQTMTASFSYLLSRINHLKNNP